MILSPSLHCLYSLYTRLETERRRMNDFSENHDPIYLTFWVLHSDEFAYIHEVAQLFFPLANSNGKKDALSAQCTKFKILSPLN